MKMKFSLAAAILTLVVGFLYQPVNTLVSFHKIGEDPLYSMDYSGGYKFLTHLGIVERFQQNSRISTVRPGSSTSFAALNPEGYALFGHNLDWMTGTRPASLLLFTDPPDGYASVAMVSIDILGYENDKIPWINRLRLLLTPYLIQNGMNEYGLAVAVTSSPCRIGIADPQKSTIDSSQAMRIILDHAKTVDEAIELLQNFNLHFPSMCGHHHIADAFGNSAIVEYLDGEAIITRGQDPWLVATNFLIAEVQPEGANGPCWRYIKAYEKLSLHHGQISQGTAMQLLEDVSTSTIYSIVYNLSTGDVNLAMGRNYELLYTFGIDMETKFMPRFDKKQIAMFPIYEVETRQP